MKHNVWCSLISTAILLRMFPVACVYSTIDSHRLSASVSGVVLDTSLWSLLAGARSCCQPIHQQLIGGWVLRTLVHYATGYGVSKTDTVVHMERICKHQVLLQFLNYQIRMLCHQKSEILFKPLIFKLMWYSIISVTLNLNLMCYNVVYWNLRPIIMNQYLVSFYNKLISMRFSVYDLNFT